MTIRKKGYYWVKISCDIPSEIAYWTGNFWQRMFHHPQVSFRDDDLYVINENQITGTAYTDEYFKNEENQRKYEKENTNKAKSEIGFRQGFGKR